MTSTQTRVLPLMPMQLLLHLLMLPDLVSKVPAMGQEVGDVRDPQQQQQQQRARQRTKVRSTSPVNPVAKLLPNLRVAAAKPPEWQETTALMVRAQKRSHNAQARRIARMPAQSRKVPSTKPS